MKLRLAEFLPPVRLWAAHLVGNAVLIALIYWWLSLGDAKAVQLAGTVLIGVLVFAGAVVLHGLAFGFGYPRKRLAIFAAWVIVALLIYWGINWLNDHTFNSAANVASWLTLKLRKPVKPTTIDAIFRWVIRVNAWVIIPALLMAPKKFRPGLRLLVEVAVFLLIALYVPYKLMFWVPDFSSMAAQTVSFVVRWGIAYLLAITAWLMLARRCWPEPVQPAPSGI